MIVRWWNLSRSEGEAQHTTRGKLRLTRPAFIRLTAGAYRLGPKACTIAPRIHLNHFNAGQSMSDRRPAHRAQRQRWLFAAPICKRRLLDSRAVWTDVYDAGALVISRAIDKFAFAHQTISAALYDGRTVHEIRQRRPVISIRVGDR